MKSVVLSYHGTSRHRQKAAVTIGYAETDLYEPIRRLLAAQGFVVKGEVKGCDIAAVRGEELWVVEMKLAFNITLLYQAMERQAVTHQVFVAIPRPKRMRGKAFTSMLRIVKKLELGLITVALDSAVQTAEIMIFPGGKPKRAGKRSESVRREIAGRIGDTPGGTTKAKINTAFRERCVKIACLLERIGEVSAAELLRHYHCDGDAYNIMYKNHYGWFQRVGKGRFALTGEGRRYLEENADTGIVAYYRMKAAEWYEMERQ